MRSLGLLQASVQATRQSSSRSEACSSPEASEASRSGGAEPSGGAGAEQTSRLGLVVEERTSPSVGKSKGLCWRGCGR